MTISLSLPLCASDNINHSYHILSLKFNLNFKLPIKSFSYLGHKFGSIGKLAVGFNFFELTRKC